jgi:hypothetical protein
LTLVVGHAHLALRDAAGGEVEHEGWLPGQRHANAARVGAKAAVAAAPGRHHGRDSTLTKCMDTSPCATAISAKWPMRPRWCALASVMMQLPCCFGARHAQRHRLFAHYLAIAALAVQREQVPCPA